jgi:polar amino acid transport system substrate-binding protein
LLFGCDSKKEEKVAAPAVPPVLPVVKKMVIGLDDSFPPMGFRDEQNQITGFDIDLAKEVAKRLGVEAEFKPIDWNAKEDELNGKRVDALWSGLTITEKRKENIAFTTPYLRNRQIVVLTAASSVKRKDDLAGKVVGVQEGSTAVEAVENNPASKTFKELKKFGDNVAALLDLKAGQLDAIVVDEVVGRYYVTQKPEEYIVLDDDFGDEKYGVGVRKDDTELLTKLQKAMDEVKQDGTATKISEKWFGMDITEN